MSFTPANRFANTGTDVWGTFTPLANQHGAGKLSFNIL